MDLGLGGRRALVFGSSEGIGRACAEALAQEGARVVLNGRDPGRLERAAREAGAAGRVPGDLRRPGEGARVTREAAGILGALDIVVTNTGGPAKGEFSGIGIEQWRDDCQSLLLAVVESLLEALPGMRERGHGRIVMISSIAAREPLPGLTTSNVLRPGLAGLARSVSNEVASDGVTVNVVLPGHTLTGRLRDLAIPQEEIRKLVPAGRAADPSDPADLVRFLASDRARHITGQSIAVDGGSLRGH